MYIACTNNNGSKYLRLVKSTKGLDKNGKYKQIQKTVKSLGPLSKFDDGKPDYLNRLKQSFKDGTPLIEELLPYVDANSKPSTVTLTFTDYEDYCFSKPLNCSNILLDNLFSNLGLSHFFSRYKYNHNLHYDLLGVVKLLTYGRLLNPESKIATFSQKEKYYGNICNCNNPYIVYEALDVIATKRTNILQIMNNSINKQIPRNKELVFYDVTNFYTEIEYADEDDELENGEIAKGLRQRGVSKEKRKSPIVQSGLFMDENGIPISFETFPGNTLDQATLRPALKNTINDFGLSRFVLVADKGLNSEKNMAELTKGGNGYIISKSIAKSNAETKAWIIDENGYEYNSQRTFKVKSRVVTKTIKDENGEKLDIKQKTVSYWSEKFYKKQYYEHKSFLDFLEDLKQNPENFRANKLNGGYLKKFLKKEVVNTKSGEKIKNKDLLTMLDEKKIEALTAYMGYYTITTSEIDMDNVEVINKYRGLTKIEDQFRIMKSDLNSRPIFVSTRDHINAHFTICFIALTMMRLIQHQIKESNGIEDCIEHWNEGVSAKRIQTAFNSWNTYELKDGYYRLEQPSEDLRYILGSYGLQLEKKIHVPKDFKNMRSKLSSNKVI